MLARTGGRGRGSARVDLRLSVLRVLVGAAALTLAVVVMVTAVLEGARPGSVGTLTTIVRVVGASLCALAGLLRLSLHDLTGHRDSTILGVGLLLVGAVLLPSSVLTTLLTTPASGLEPVVRLIETVTLLVLMAIYVDRRGQLARSPKDVLLLIGPVLILTGAAGGAAMYFASTQVGQRLDLLSGTSAVTTSVLAMLAWAFAATKMSYHAWPPGGQEALAYAWMAALVCALRALGYAGDHDLLLIAALAVLLAGITAAALAMRDLDLASRSARHEAAARATLLAETRLDLTEESARGSALRHDALNSLAALRAAVECLRLAQPDLDTRSEYLLRSALGEVGHLEHLLTRKGEAEPVSFAIDEVILGIVESRRATGLEVEFVPSDHRAFGVPGDLATVLQNLLVNAHVHGGGRDVKVSCLERHEFVDIHVHDSGPGVPVEVRHAIFESGVRASSRPGAGLGLHISRQLMREQGGDVLLERTFRGTAFVVRVPAAKAQQLQ